MKQTSIIPKYVENIPETLNVGVLYICERYHIAAHKCCCGCGQEVVTPLTPVDWLIRTDKDLITLFPSIGNWSFACQSHYWIKRNKVSWSGAMTKKEIERIRARDNADKYAYIASVNSKKEMITPLPKENCRSIENISQTANDNGIALKIWQAIKNWCK